MKADFWHDRWESGRTGFHQDEANRYLVQFWDRLGVAVSAKVFVPLCGKSKDMLWLRDHGHTIIGAELSPIATRDFFDENGLKAESSKQGEFEQWEGEGVRILCGDVFKLAAIDLDGVGAVYDRAGLIALPPEVRRDYVNHLRDILPLGIKLLLVTIAYPQDQKGGPPFSVQDDEVQELFREGFEVAQVASENVLAESRRFAGFVDYLNENAYLLTRV
ncbi:MAG: thiopurine S-methyltransferase [Candidatus Latescibacteria bacterium]|nr:thiopurine S-methyltransferase [Candidatus Latescibacterota bacterium]MBT5832260.1 thiopurine S-methyltransferase [Candidatus Latescibacterota bacterium]